MALVNAPPNGVMVDENGLASTGWAAFFSTAFRVLVALTGTGTTAQRPTTFLWVGRPYFDTTLNRPIWYTGTNWIKADGTVV